GGGGNDRLDEGLVHAVEQRPGPLVVHAHLTRGGGDRASIPNAFEQLCLARAYTSARLKNDAYADASHARVSQNRTASSHFSDCVAGNAVERSDAAENS